MWLSVAKFPLPMPAASSPRLPYLGAILCATGWRKAYSVDWSVIQPGLAATLPATDELVVDYAAAEASETVSISHIERTKYRDSRNAVDSGFFGRGLPQNDLRDSILTRSS